MSISVPQSDGDDRHHSTTKQLGRAKAVEVMGHRNFDPLVQPTRF